MNEREEANRFECCERCGEPPALCGCWSTNNDLVGRLRSELAAIRQQLAEKDKQIAEARAEVADLRVKTAIVGAIQIDPAKHSGAPCVKCARFPIAQLLGELADGHSISEIATCFDLPQDSLSAALHAVAHEVKDLLSVCDLREQLAAQADELARLRERCEAAEKAVAFFFECQIAIQLPGGNADETFGFETLRDGRFAVTKWVDAGQFFHIRDTPMEAFQDAITDNWLPDSNNKGGE